MVNAKPICILHFIHPVKWKKGKRSSKNLSHSDFSKKIYLRGIKCSHSNYECSMYSHVSNKRRGWNKRRGGAKVAKSINVDVGILQLESSPFIFKQLRYWVKNVAYTASSELKQFLCILRKNDFAEEDFYFYIYSFFIEGGFFQNRQS